MSLTTTAHLNFSMALAEDSVVSISFPSPLEFIPDEV